MRRLGLLCGALLAACGDEGPSTPATRLDAGAPADAETAPRALRATVEIVDGLGSEALLGDPLDLVLAPGGAPAVVYGAVPVGSTTRIVRYAERRGADDWAVEDAVTPGAQAPGQGELLALSAGVWGGRARVVYLGGDGDGRVNSTFPTDLVLATRSPGGWTERTLVDTSGEAPGTCPDLQNYCNSGNVVGSHAALAVGPDEGWAVVYRDTHFGFGSDDLRRSDVELYSSAGGPVLVDPERGGGAWADIALLPGGDPALAYVIESSFAGDDARGIWVATSDGGRFTLSKVTSAVTTHKLALAADAQGALWLAFFDAAARDLVVARASPPYARWALERVDEAGSTGLHPDLVLSPAGAPHIVYGYCGPTGDRGCPGDPGPSAEVRLARRDGGSWRIDPVADGEGRGGVGFFNRALRLPSGDLAVAYQDAENLDVMVALVETQP
jgi:hypothetical protein